MRKPLPPWTQFQEALYSLDPVEHAKMMKVTDTHELFRNSRYTVCVRHLGQGWTHLSIKRNDRALIRDWRELQRIKNEICGPEREGIELFPAESRLVDSANQFHLWVGPDGLKFPVGYDTGRLVINAPTDGTKAKQREFEEEAPDVQSASELMKRYEQTAASKFLVGTPEYYDCIIEQRSADLAKDAAAQLEIK